VLPLLGDELKAWEEPKVWLLLPPPLEKVGDLVDYIALTYLTRHSTAPSSKRKTLHKPADLCLQLDGFTLLSDEVRGRKRITGDLGLDILRTLSSVCSSVCSWYALSVITTRWS
jgi:hypothetical protein